MGKRSIILMIALLLLASCAPSINDEDEVLQKKDEDTNSKTAIVPSYRYSDEDYKMILPYRPSKARGVIVRQLGNRLDIDEMEAGLRRHSKEVFDPNKYFFEEGQYLTEDIINGWLGRKLTEEQLNKEKKETKESEAELQQGLNPPIEDIADDKKKEKEEAQRESPRYLSHILEQNFLKKKEDNTVELVGVSIGLAIKSVYRFQTEIGGPYFYEEISEKKMLDQGKKIAQTVLERVRKIEGLEKVPIMIALYREESQDSPVPGNFVAKTTVSENSMSIDEWKTVKEDYVLFPSNESEKTYFEDNQIVDSFGKKIQEYFPNYVGMIAEGFYMDEKLEKLSIEIPIEFYGKGEVIGFTQYAYGLVKEMFPDYYDLEIKVMSTEKMESLIYRDAGKEDPVVHIFD